MVADLEQLMRDTVSTAPTDDFDMKALLETGRRRVRRRRTTRGIAGTAAALAVIGAVGAASVLTPSNPSPPTGPAGVPVPEGTVLYLDQAELAVEGRDFTEVITRDIPVYPTPTNATINGVTDDGLLVLEQSPGGRNQRAALTLIDPATGEQDPLPNASSVDVLSRPRPLALGADRLVYWVSPRAAFGDTDAIAPIAQVFERATRRWSTLTWPDLPTSTDPETTDVVLGPDNRVYLTLNPSEFARSEFSDESGSPGVSYELWSVSLTDPTDVRDEGMRVGQVAFTSDEMVWTDRDNGNGGLVHVRDLATGTERSFDPRSGARCNLLGLSVSKTDVVLSQYCGTYPGRVRDDRIQVLTKTGEPVVTIQGSNIAGGINHSSSGDVIAVTNLDGDDSLTGAYTYDLESARLLRFSEANSIWAVGGGPTPPDYLTWATPLGEGEGVEREGLTQHVVQLLR